MDLSDVRVVMSPEQMQRVGAFRYGVYVQEQGKSARYADHAARVLIEPADRAASSLVYYIERNGIVFASLRAELLEEQDCAHAASFVTFGFMPPSQMLFLSRLMVAADARGSSAMARFFQAGFALAILKGRSLGLLTCRPALVAVFERFGCLQYADAFTHAEHGLQVPMAILVESAYLQARAAPLSGWLAEYRQESPYTERFLDVARTCAVHARSRVREARALVA